MILRLVIIVLATTYFLGAFFFFWILTSERLREQVDAQFTQRGLRFREERRSLFVFVATLAWPLFFALPDELASRAVRPFFHPPECSCCGESRW